MGNCLWWCPVASTIQLRCGTNEVWGTSGPPVGSGGPMSISAERRVYFCQLVEALIEEHDDDTSERTIRMRSHGATTRASTTGCAWMTG